MRLSPPRALKAFRLPLVLVLSLPACEFATTPEQEGGPMTLVAADRDGHIYRVDETTGAETLILPTKVVLGLEELDIGVVSSMSWIPSTEAWWLGTGGRSACRACILTLDPATGEATILHDLSDDLRAIPGLAVDPATGLVYTFEGDDDGYLFEIVVATGQVLEIITGLTEGYSGKGTTFGHDGFLYVSGSNKLTRINVVAKTHTLVGLLTFAGFPEFERSSQTIGSMATRADGTVFGILQDGGGSGVSKTYLVTVDLATAVVTNVGSTTVLLDGLAYIPTSLIE